MMLCRAAILLVAVAAVGAELRKTTAGYKPQTCNKKCGSNEACEIQRREVCIPLTCALIKCSAGETCKDTEDGPDCVPDVPSCEGFFCPRGTNCYIRKGSPICLPNTCEVRECKHGLTCIDTPSGALCRRGKKTLDCKKKYCPPNSMCETGEDGPTCKII